MREPIDQSETASNADRPVSAFGRLLRVPWRGWALLCLGLMLLALALTEISRLLYGTQSAVLTMATGLFMLPMLGAFGLAIVARLAKCSSESDAQKRLSWWGCGLSVVGFSIFALIVMIPAWKRAQHAAAEQTWVTKTFGDEHFQLSVPATWVPGPAADTAPGELYLIETRYDLNLTATAVAKADVTVETLPEIRDLAIRGLSSVLTAPEVTRFETETVGTSRVIDSVVTGSVDGHRVWYLIRHLDSGAYWVEVHTWTTPSQLEEHQDVLEQIVDSVAPVR